VFTGLADDNPSAPKYRAEQAAALQTLAPALQQQGNAREAEDAYAMALTMLRELVEREPDNATFKRYLAHTEGNLSAFYLASGRDGEAFDPNRRVAARLEKRPDATPPERQALAKALDNLGIADVKEAVPGLGGHAADRRRAGEVVEEAGARFESALKIRRQLVAAQPEELPFKGDLAAGLGNQVVWFLNFRPAPEGQTKAIELLREAAAINERLVERLPDFPQYAKACL
jgi:tetratricopeptide (TPR) repeat protein